MRAYSLPRRMSRTENRFALVVKERGRTADFEFGIPRKIEETRRKGKISAWIDFLSRCEWDLYGAGSLKSQFSSLGGAIFDRRADNNSIYPTISTFPHSNPPKRRYRTASSCGNVAESSVYAHSLSVVSFGNKGRTRNCSEFQSESDLKTSTAPHITVRFGERESNPREIRDRLGTQHFTARLGPFENSHSSLILIQNMFRSIIASTSRPIIRATLPAARLAPISRAYHAKVRSRSNSVTNW